MLVLLLLAGANAEVDEPNNVIFDDLQDSHGVSTTEGAHPRLNDPGFHVKHIGNPRTLENWIVFFVVAISLIVSLSLLIYLINKNSERYSHISLFKSSTLNTKNSRDFDDFCSDEDV